MYKSLPEMKYDDLLRFHLKMCACAYLLQFSQLHHFCHGQQPCTACKQHGSQFPSPLFVLASGSLLGVQVAAAFSTWSPSPVLRRRAEACCCVMMVRSCLLAAKRLGFCPASGSGCTFQASRLEMWAPTPKPSFVLVSFEVGQGIGRSLRVAAFI